MPDRMTGLRRDVLKSLYWPFMFAMTFGFGGALATLEPPIGQTGPMLPSWQIGLLIGVLGVMGCATIVISGATDHEAGAERAPLGVRVWVWIANGGFFVGMVAGFLVGAALWRLSQSNMMVLSYFTGLATTFVGIGGMVLSRRHQGRRA